ncbi:hypothetical protein J5X91_04280 [Pseudoalteromonas sp. K222D]|uniref:hypothetical protein n=1 Tax=Pseudoalteromonas sp. K222D TaxID=2820756 RepID=UPI001AD6AB59|nr:hypothetical protein [Pseudoalteromonas sp. K222D]MBO7925489.1 hypothetical protein [Pseudoalteromonas sp. K222D]
MNMHDISVVAETNDCNEANEFLKLGWKLLQTSSGYFFEEDIEFRKVQQKCYTLYSLGWVNSSAEAEYPESYLRLTGPF